MENKRIVFTKTNTAELLDSPIRTPKDNEILVETAFSTISCGTEKANIIGDPNIGIFTKETDPAVFPRILGYSSSGTVIAKGNNVKDLEIGDRVAMSWSIHEKYNCIPATNAVKLPSESVTLSDAAISHISTFPMAALRKTELELGESFMVMGLGILGLIAVMLGKAAGATPVIAVDPIKERREKALKFGADYALDPFEDNFAETVKNLTNGGVNAAIEVTGLGAGLNQTLDCMQRFGRIRMYQRQKFYCRLLQKSSRTGNTAYRCTHTCTSAKRKFSTRFYTA